MISELSIFLCTHWSFSLALLAHRNLFSIGWKEKYQSHFLTVIGLLLSRWPSPWYIRGHLLRINSLNWCWFKQQCKAWSSYTFYYSVKDCMMRKVQPLPFRRDHMQEKQGWEESGMRSSTRIWPEAFSFVVPSLLFHHVRLNWQSHAWELTNRITFFRKGAWLESGREQGCGILLETIL